MGRISKLLMICFVFCVIGLVVDVLYQNQVTLYRSLDIKNSTLIFLADSFHPRRWLGFDHFGTTTPTPQTTRPPYIVRKFTEMKFGPLFIFGAVGGNSSISKTWDHFRVYGLLDKYLYKESKLSCCLRYELNNEIIIQKLEPIAKRNFIVPYSMWNFYVACPNPRYLSGVIPRGLAVMVDNFTCSENHVTYVPPYLPMKEPDKIAIGTKTAFGNISAEQIIEWMEAYRYLGVDKIVSYFIRNINEDALKVLMYYSSTGFLDLYYYEPANEAKYPRIKDFKTKTYQRWNDQATVVDDSFERMSGYRYFGIIDHDEFFIPGKNWTLKTLLWYLEKLKPTAAGYVLLSQYYFTSWGRYNDSDMFLCSYTRREDTSPRRDNNKNFYMPARVALGGEDTHVIHAAEGYKMYSMNSIYGYVRHFRKCRPEPEKFKKCMLSTKRIVDYEVANWSKAFRDNVRNVRKIVLGGP